MRYCRGRAGSWLCLSLLCIAAAACTASVQKGASLSLRARWEGTPYLLEAAEFLATEGKQLFWKYLEALDLGGTDSTSTQCWQQITQQAAQLLPKQVAQILPLILGVRQYSATLETFRQLARQLHPDQNSTCCFVDLDGSVASSLSELKEQLQQLAGDAAAKRNSSVQMLDIDHVYNPAADVPGAAHAVLYGPPGSSCWAEMHQALVAHLEQAQGARALVYATRPLYSDVCEVHPCVALGTEEQLVLPGYGVEAVLKNMEYSAMDDKEKAAAARDAGEGEGADSKEALGEVKGFDFDVLVARKPHLRQELLTFRDTLASSDDDQTLKVWDIKDASLQATTRVMKASKPLHLLMDISQNFPSIVSSLTKQPVQNKLRKQVKSTQEYISTGGNYMILNGLMMEIKNFELYSFLERLRIELRLQAVLSSLEVPKPVAMELLQKRADDTSDNLQELRLDLTPTKKVLWINDLEKDKSYSNFGRSMYDLLNVYPGRMKVLARNIFNAVSIVDPLSSQGLTMGQLWWRGYQLKGPMRMGLLPVVPAVVQRLVQEQANPGVPVEIPKWEDMSLQEQFMRGFLTLKSAFGPVHAYYYWQLLTDDTVKKESSALLQGFQDAWSAAAKGASGTFANAKRAERASKVQASQAAADLKAGAKFSSEVGMQLQELCGYMIRKGLGHLAKPLLWFNGVVQPIPEGTPEILDREIGAMIVWQHLPQLQEKVYYNFLDDEEEDVLDALIELYQSVRSWNPRLLSTEEDSDAQKLSLAALPQHAGAKDIPYLHTNGSYSRMKAVTHLVVTDLSHARGRALAAASLDFLIENDGSDADGARVGLVLAPQGGASALDAAVLVLQEAYTNKPELLKLLKSVIIKGHKMATMPAASATAAELKGVTSAVAAAELEAAKLLLGPAQLQLAAGKVERMQQLVKEVVGLHAGQTAVISNGRMLVDYNPGAASQPPPLTAEDFILMQLYGQEFQPGKALAKALKAAKKDQQVDMDVEQLNSVVMVAASVFSSQVYPDSRFGAMSEAKQLTKALADLKTKAVSTNVTSSNPQGADLSFLAIIDPLTRVAQRSSQVLAWVADLLDPDVKLYLNPSLDLTDMPLKSFYRYALPEFTLEADGQLAMPGNPTAYFPRLPLKRVLTLNMETPESWLVEPVMALHDLDNLVLANIPERVAYAEYELEAIMLSGSCVEKFASGKRGAPPRGLQLHLGTSSQPHLVDTLVMSNMGYFQLKASPGLWLLSIAPGRSRALYQLLSSRDVQGAPKGSWYSVGQEAGQGTGLDATENATQVVLSNFLGKQISVKVQKRPGKESVSLLDEKAAQEGGAAAAGAAADDPEEESGGKGLVSAKEAANNTINVFTVASGHMYERLQKIMILSVIKNTKSRVKFWIIKNYMSPHHKRIIPAMAAQFGFDYEFVTYKWPHWLHKQTDKQRIIWAYKILFLDVLFPLDVPRMIFVDSDQVVRTDLAELYNMDLKGAPLAYTPFCDNNKEMDEFRFWKGGFWLNHLRGKPYHISALYLIDLKRFRKMAAGDQFRVVYEQLSKDPNSLANLDQDLPNYAQHQIPIFSLPQEWLWCESWCGNQTKPKARTIDLCNNPKTKEPKLNAARRIIKEWPSLDEEQAAFTAEVDGKFAAQEAAFAESGDSSSSGGGEGGSSDAGGEDDGGAGQQGQEDWRNQPAAAGAGGPEAEGPSHDEL